MEREDAESAEASGSDSDSEDSSDSESDSASDSEDEDTLPKAPQTPQSSLSRIPTLTHAVTDPVASSTLMPSTRTLSASTSRTTIQAVLPTAGSSLGSTLLVGEGDVDAESETDGIASDDDSDDETTPGGKASSTSTITRPVPTLTAIVPPGHSGASKSTGTIDITQKPSPEVTSTGISTLSTSLLPVPTTTLNRAPQDTPAAQVLGPQVGLERSHMNGGAVAGIVFGVVGK